MDATDLDDPLQTCPYDKSHRILKSRMQFHLVRCRKNHTSNKDQKRTCPFDAVHVVNSIEYEYHVANCPKSGSVLNFMFSSEAQRCVGSVSLEEVNNVYVPPPSENWDADPPVPTYDALKHAKNRNVLLSEIGLSKAKKRQFKNSERLRIQCLEESGVQSNRFLDTEKEDPDKPLRLPHNVSKAMSMTSITSEENLNESIQKLTLDSEVRLRPPRTKSVALSVCSNTDDEDEILNAIKLSNSTKCSERPVLNINGMFNTSSTAEENTKRFQSVVTEASKKMVSVWNQSIIGSTEEDNIGLQRSNKEVEDEPIDTRFLLTDLATSNSDSSINNDSDNNSCASFTNIANSMTKYNMSQSDDAIIEISTRLATLSNLERDLKREKAKLKQKVDQYYASSGSAPSLANPRCAANFSKVKEHKDL